MELLGRPGETGRRSRLTRRRRGLGGDGGELPRQAGTESRAAAYVLLSVDGTRMCGVAIGRDVVNASLQAVINGAAQIRALRQSA